MQALQADQKAAVFNPTLAAFAPAKIVAALVARQRDAPRAIVASLALNACSTLTLHGHLDAAAAALQVAIRRFDAQSQPAASVYWHLVQRQLLICALQAQVTAGDAQVTQRAWKPFLLAVDTLLCAQGSVQAVNAVLQTVDSGVLEVQQLVRVGVLAYTHLRGSPALALALLHICRAAQAVARTRRHHLNDAVPGLSLLRQLLLDAVLCARPPPSRALCRRILVLEDELASGGLPAVVPSVEACRVD